MVKLLLLYTTLFTLMIPSICFSQNNNKSEKKNSNFHRNGHDNYFSIGTGYGISYSGIGIRSQVRFGNQFGGGLHFGVGSILQPEKGEDNTRSIGVSIGAKIFIWKYLYIGTQYSEWAYENKFMSDKITNLFGTYHSVGIDYISKKHFGFNIGLGIGETDVFLYDIGIDVGLTYKL